MRRVVTVMALAVLGVILLAGDPLRVTAQPVACPLNMHLRARAKGSLGPKAGVMAGKELVVTASLSKIDRKDMLGQGSVSITLPPGLCVLSTLPRRTRIMPDSGTVFWPNVNLNKTATFKFKVKAHVQSTYNGSIATFDAGAFIPARDCGNTAAPKEVRAHVQMVCVGRWVGAFGVSTTIKLSFLSIHVHHARISSASCLSGASVAGSPAPSAGMGRAPVSCRAPCRSPIPTPPSCCSASTRAASRQSSCRCVAACRKRMGATAAGSSSLGPTRRTRRRTTATTVC